MDVRIDKKSEIPLPHQLAEQIVFSITTEKLKPGQALPSVRELARRLKIHHNTVSQAYRDLVRRGWLVGRRGSRVVVKARETKAGQANGSNLDDFINTTIRLAREQGYSLQTLREQVTARLLAQPPDHILIVEPEEGLRRLMHEEIREVVEAPTKECSLVELRADPGLAIGALTVAGQYLIEDVDRFAPKSIPAITLAFNGADEHLELVRKLQKPSIVAVVSVSQVFLTTARSLLAPALGVRHVLQDVYFPLAHATAFRSADLVFADSIACPKIKHSTIVHYRLIRPSSLEYLSTAMQSYQSSNRNEGLQARS
jgi:DNA-binding transcriptional regulator YhcF (GntR family)